MNTTICQIQNPDSPVKPMMQWISLGILGFFLMWGFTSRAQDPGTRVQQSAIEINDWAMADLGAFATQEVASAPERIFYSNNGKYFVVREEMEMGPNFGVQTMPAMQMRPAPVITSEVAKTGLPEEVDGRLYTDRYQGMADYFDVKFFFKLGPEYQNELYYIIVGRKGIGVYDYFIDDRLYRTTILTRHWKMNVLFDRQGNIEKITRKLRGQGSTDYEDFLAVVNSVKNCSSMK